MINSLNPPLFVGELITVAQTQLLLFKAVIPLPIRSLLALRWPGVATHLLLVTSEWLVLICGRSLLVERLLALRWPVVATLVG